MKSRKSFTYEYVGGSDCTRVVAPSVEKFNKDIHFQPSEESDYLAEALRGVPYATFLTDDMDKMGDWLQNGFVDGNNVLWVPFFSYWKEEEGHAFMCPQSAGVVSLEDIGVLTEMKTPAEVMKVGKYVNRLFAALPKTQPFLDTEGKLQYQEAIWGKEVAWNENDSEAIVLIDKGDSDLSDEDRELSIRYVDLKSISKEQAATVDGSLIISEKAARVLRLAKNPHLGMAWRGTFGTERGLGKGHLMYKDDINVDIVIYGPKTIVKNDRFYFGSMGELHVSIPHTDRQAFVNFHFHRPELAVPLAKAFIRSVIQASKDEESLRSLMLMHTRDMTSADMDNEAWVLRRAMTFGLSHLRFPGLYRRVRNYLMTKVMHLDQRARIPMEGQGFSVAKYAYVLPDSNAIDSEGNVVLDKAIPVGTIVFPDLEPGTKVVCYRQPSENTNAWVALTVVHKPEYDRFEGRGICLIGQGAKNILGRLGGGDMDDSFVIVHDPVWVEAFHTMRPYPETEKLTEESISEDVWDEQDVDVSGDPLDSFADELLEDIQDGNMTRYTNKHVWWQIDMAKNARAGIGPVVNYGIMDMLLSDPDHNASMLSDLADEPEAREWLEGYANEEYLGNDLLPDTTPYGYHARKYMTNLELVIDGNVKDRTLLSKLGDVSGAIKRAHRECQVYPVSMAGNVLDVLSGKLDERFLITRIPAKRALKGGFTVARSLFCRCLEDLVHLRQTLETVFIEREYAIVRAADRNIRSEWEREPELATRVGGKFRNIGTRDDPEWERVDDGPSLKDIWAQGWKEANEKGIPVDKAYPIIWQSIADELAGEDDDMMERLAIELYFQTYRRDEPAPRVNAITGKLQNYQDGLLWSPVFANHFINALRGGVDRRHPFTGYYRMVTLDSAFRNRLKDVSVMVEVRNHAVHIQDHAGAFTIFVGQVWGRSFNGIFRMDSGLIEFRKAKEPLLPEDAHVLAQRPLSRLFKPVQVIEQPKSELSVPKQEPKTLVGRWLKKALDHLK